MPLYTAPLLRRVALPASEASEARAMSAHSVRAAALSSPVAGSGDFFPESLVSDVAFFSHSAVKTWSPSTL